MHAQLLGALQAWRQAQRATPAPDATVFESMPDMKAFRADLAAAGIRYEVPGRGVLDFHALRKTFGTWMAASRVPQRLRQAAMRHAKPDLTETVYMDEDLLPVFEHVSMMPAIGLPE
ncbi:MAG: tyrosine-type recombinase/integrase [Phycisphaerales bacterium]